MEDDIIGDPGHKPYDSCRNDAMPDTAYYDKAGFFNRLFFYWVRYWVNNVQKSSFDSERLHPLLNGDQIGTWQCLFAKNISDGILRAEQKRRDAVLANGDCDKNKLYRNIILRALFLTFGRRVLLLLVATVVLNVGGVGISMLLKLMLDKMSSADCSYAMIIRYALYIAVIELASSMFEQHVIFYNCRLETIMESAISITLFQHGMCHRRAYAATTDGRSELSACKGVVHSWPCKDDECASNPLLCPARRYQNRELPPSMCTYVFLDTYALMSPVEALVIGVRFFTTLITALVIIRTQISTDVAKTIIILVSMILLTGLIESKDYRYAKTYDVLGNINLVQAMGLDDIGYNIIQDSRNDEVSVLFTRLTLTAFNRSTMMTIGSIVFLVILLDYIGTLETSLGTQPFEAGIPITLMFIVGKITKATENLPKTVKVVAEAYASILRVEKFLTTCSPNYYLTCKTKPQPMDAAMTALASKGGPSLKQDVVVNYEDASFAWFQTIEESLEEVPIRSPILNGINFELKRGEIKIITGNQGCGKTSFIKSILGDMSLVSGSMAVAPLSTGMPIFYTSQEVWLPSGSIRSIITFGYAFDEEIYKRVTSAVELESDFASWEDGDMRVISAKGYSLSGGQRVRLSLARALYAYLVFSKANERLVGDRCCFLVCLDEPFNGLDTKVASSIARNLLNRVDGLLIHDDVAVVLAISKMSMEICFNNSNMHDLVGIPVYRLGSRGLRMIDSIGSPDSRDVTVPPMGDVALSEPESLRTYKSLTTMPPAVMRTNVYSVSSSSFSNPSFEGKSPTASKEDLEKEKMLNSGSTQKAYWVYFYCTGYVTCILILVMVVAGIALEKANSVFVASWSDSIKKSSDAGIMTINEGRELLKKHEHTVNLIKGFSVSYVILIYCGTILTAIASMRCAKKLHQFAINSLFFKGTDELSLKKSFGDIITLLSTDLFYIDEILGRTCLLSVISFMRLAIQFVTMCAAAPIIIPLPIIMVVYLYTQVVGAHITSSNRLQCFMFKAIARINATFTDVIGGAAIYRGFRMEFQCLEYLYESSEYYFRTRFLKKVFPAWLIIISKILTSCIIFMATLLILAYAHYTGKSVQIATLGLIITLAMEVNSLITSFVYNHSLTERMMCSVSRYEKHLLQGNSSLNEKFDSMNETVLRTVSDKDDWDKERCANLLKRRKSEFRHFVFRRYRSLASTLFYKPRVEFLDCGKYLCGEHVSLEMENVSVPQQVSATGENRRYILKAITASARAGDVVGIMGRTGAGKSTLLSVLQNIAAGREGSVLLDGRELNTIPRKVLRHIIGVLPQMPFVFKGWTLRRFLDPRMLHSDDEIMHALECCGLMDMVKSLPEIDPLDAVMVEQNLNPGRGFYLVTPLIKLKSPDEQLPVLRRKSFESSKSDDKSGAVFSDSQLRMLSFARLLLYRRTCRLLLIDEPPSDNCASVADDTAIVHAVTTIDGSIPVYDLVRIYFKHCTTFIVAHDKNALKSCQHLWYVENGAIVRKVSGADNVAEFLNSTVS
ncbi:ABC transporter family protein [Babesia ovata]|uniref:ABC transporter family protein n=1 Tax=Babesia ovata TaxID=189622 RepID=A0A2H6K7V5_9APIC|nr:ABC transporter family protein [Babesia ovata]GBE59058.1 ABC transporter family protein [Babesia ovata]